MSKLFLVAANGAAVEFTLRPGDNTIGRNRANDIVLGNMHVSRHHAVISVDPAFVSIRDLGSQNGTFVNGERIESQVLLAGDVMVLGGCQLQFFQSDQEFRAVEAQGLASVPNWLGRGHPDESDGDAPTAREDLGPR
ncbi:MAG: FHA domain-containing protein [Comamonadaceae bacterium]|nr:MAG: FHA domain-containing protein [Comamonadaceae bacterium]